MPRHSRPVQTVPTTPCSAQFGHEPGTSASAGVSVRFFTAGFAGVLDLGDFNFDLGCEAASRRGPLPMESTNREVPSTDVLCSSAIPALMSRKTNPRPVAATPEAYPMQPPIRAPKNIPNTAASRAIADTTVPPAEAPTTTPAITETQNIINNADSNASTMCRLIGALHALVSDPTTVRRIPWEEPRIHLFEPAPGNRQATCEEPKGNLAHICREPNECRPIRRRPALSLKAQRLRTSPYILRQVALRFGRATPPPTPYRRGPPYDIGFGRS